MLNRIFRATADPAADADARFLALGLL